MEIILLRHGKPEIELSGWYNAKDFKSLIVRYRKSSIKDFPSNLLIRRFETYYAICSDLKRSMETANRLNNLEIKLSDQVFAETEIPHFDHSYIKLPIIIWLIILRILWLLGFDKNGESFKNANIRAEKAALILIALCETNNKIILIGHGIMNRLIATQLRKRNWQGPKSPGKNYWQYKSYIKIL